MNQALDVYTPWRESEEQLQARHVGRSDVVRAVLDTTRQFLAGRPATHLFLYGPRGMGKSHVLALARKRIDREARQAGVPVLIVPEDIPKLHTADDLLARIRSAGQRPGWQRWSSRGAGGPVELSRAVVFFEGLDRQLDNLPEDERRTLRRILDQDLSLLLVATGVSLPSSLTDRETAFYGAFSPWPLESLSGEEAQALLDNVAGESVRSQPGWPARREALTALAGGNPRTLTALGQSCANAPEAWASDHLHTVVAQFTAHYQMRFRDLPPQGQQVVELLSEAPSELSPTELSEYLGISLPSASMVCRRLEQDGVLQSRSEGRRTWYRLTEPLFRFWNEYRTAPWEQTRAGWLGRLIEAVLQPPDIAQAWMTHPDEERYQHDIQTALIALGFTAPERLDNLMDALGHTPLGELATRSAILAEQLRHESPARLHPELARLKELLLSPPALKQA